MYRYNSESCELFMENCGSLLDSIKIIIKRVKHLLHNTSLVLPYSSSLESSTPPSPITSRMSEAGSSPPRTHNGRQRLRPWLIGLIDRGEVKGLEWMNKEKTLFKIPWKHAGKQDYNPEEDSKIFKVKPELYVYTHIMLEKKICNKILTIF